MPDARIQQKTHEAARTRKRETMGQVAVGDPDYIRQLDLPR
jgi:hypothetical protein